MPSSTPPSRPDPDALLRTIQADEAHARRGKLKIFFGFAPGVGKTYRMLQVARDLVIEQHLDVVVGIVEDHRRTETARMALGLELLPRRKVDYRGKVLEELDLDAALARKPGLLLVDELAHSNAPGSRHAKRWQDVEELLAAGIDVLTTMNVQHVESLNDVVAQITKVAVRETVPDSVLDAADAIELVDISPEELLARLREGKVYIPEQAQRATRHFFQRGNLLALRELALRRTAQRVDDEVREYRQRHGVATPWPAGERILVCVGPAPGSGRLLRAAARMAAGLRCPWSAVYVETIAAGAMSRQDQDRLDAHLRLAESLGAEVIRLVGARVSETLLAHAREHNVTRLVVGKPTHSRLRDRLRGSLLDELVRGSGAIDVHVISGVDDDERPPRPAAPEPARAPLRSYAAAAALLAVTSALALLLRRLLGLPDLEMLFLLAVMVVAVWLGRGPSVFAAALGVACYDFFFVPPYYTFSVGDRRYFLTFAMMFAVGFGLSELAGRLRRQERGARAREERTAGLYALARELSSAEPAAEIAKIATRHAAALFSAPAVVSVASPTGELGPAAAVPLDVTRDPESLAVARWSLEHDEVVGQGTDTLPGAKCLCAPLRVGASRLGVLSLVLRDGAGLRGDQRGLLDAFCRQVAIALERARLSDVAQTAALRAKSEEMRSSLLSAVSHDLRTPLASITGAATVLRDEPHLDPGTRAELLGSVVDEAERLERLVANLLDMTRLTAGGVALRRDWVPLEEVIGSALSRLEARLADRPISVAVAPEVPLVFVDPVLFEQVFVNLLENAHKYTPPRSPIELRGWREGERVAIEVADRGAGLPQGAQELVFEKFYRGPSSGVAGVGLGLPICKGVVEAHGGVISAQQREGGGARFLIYLPYGAPPPVVAEAP